MHLPASHTDEEPLAAAPPTIPPARLGYLDPRRARLGAAAWDAAARAGAALSVDNAIAYALGEDGEHGTAADGAGTRRGGVVRSRAR